MGGSVVTLIGLGIWGFEGLDWQPLNLAVTLVGYGILLTALMLNTIGDSEFTQLDKILMVFFAVAAAVFIIPIILLDEAEKARTRASG